MKIWMALGFACLLALTGCGGGKCSTECCTCEAESDCNKELSCQPMSGSNMVGTFCGTSTTKCSCDQYYNCEPVK